MTQTIQAVDSHTGGEPTRIIIDGGPDLGDGPLTERVELFRRSHDSIRKATVMEPRGNDVLVGGLLVKPTVPDCTAGIIFFNNHGYLGMCGHGLIGLMATLKHLGRIEDGQHRIETPVGVVNATVQGTQTSVANVPSFRLKKDVEVEVPGHGRVVGDIAWGGNWFFLVKDYSEPIELKRAHELTQLTLTIRTALSDQGVTGQGDWIDHVELFGPPSDTQNHSRNFVLCPGGAFDRSPCGTGTSAKLACLAADGVLEPGVVWRQESIIGSVFLGSFENLTEEQRSSFGQQLPESAIVPTIEGSAYVTGELKLILNSQDPFCMGIDS